MFVRNIYCLIKLAVILIVVVGSALYFMRKIRR
ncbi:hypothetical protein ES708_28815 [subsurface metagenome]